MTLLGLIDPKGLLFLVFYFILSLAYCQNLLEIKHHNKLTLPVKWFQNLAHQQPRGGGQIASEKQRQLWL